MNQALLGCMLDMGELLLCAGAEAMRVEDTIVRLCRVYGFGQAQVFTITSSIVVTVPAPDGEVLTQTRRILRRQTDLDQVEQVNALSRRVCAAPMPLAQLQQEIAALRVCRVRPWGIELVTYAFVSAVFSLFFGGSGADACVSALTGCVLFWALRQGKKLQINDILLHGLACALAAFVASMFVRLGFAPSADKIVIGNIMLVIPGIALTTALRDMLSGDLLCGLLGLSEAVIKALAVAIGFAAVLMKMGV